MRNVIITGGSRGIGLAVSQKLALAGFCVIAIARKQTVEFDVAAQQVEKDGRGAMRFFSSDLGDISQLQVVVKQLKNEFGPLFGLVNNAGQSISGILTNAPDDDVDHLIKINVVAPIILTKYVVRSMMTGTGGRIVNMSSVVGFTGYSGLSVYSASKAALVGFTHSLARELGPLGITVNAIAPGFVETDLTHALTGIQQEKIIRRSALRRMISVDDIANTVEFLFSEKAKNITGTVITVDAGNTA
jgi:3-oxoacyl-[acyl-carrier protein] reductase